MKFVTENMVRSADKIAWYNGITWAKSNNLRLSYWRFRNKVIAISSLPSISNTICCLHSANFGHIARLHEETLARPVCTPMSRSTAHGAQSWVGTSFSPAPLWMDQLDPKGQQRYSNCTVFFEKKRSKVYSTYFITNNCWQATSRMYCRTTSKTNVHVT